MRFSGGREVCLYVAKYCMHIQGISGRHPAINIKDKNSLHRAVTL